MRPPRFIIIAIACLFAVCADSTGVDAEDTSGDLAVIVHLDNPAKPNASTLEALFLRKERSWSNGEPVIVFNLGPENPNRINFDHVVLAMSPDEVARYWLDQRIRGGGTAPREVGEPALVVKLVAKLKTAIAYVPARSDLRDVRVIARVRAGKLVSP